MIMFMYMLHNNALPSRRFTMCNNNTYRAVGFVLYLLDFAARFSHEHKKIPQRTERFMTVKFYEIVYNIRYDCNYYLFCVFVLCHEILNTLYAQRRRSKDLYTTYMYLM